jgi:hypothetical protein
MARHIARPVGEPGRCSSSFDVAESLWIMASAAVWSCGFW